ncbi:MAG TPA: hypothetical protein VL096_06040 [Pirellulaceae bacterium]|nr:hypothetical protein [Pirellulaceae bacterium]
MSLASLMHCAPENVKSVVIGVDPKGPFSTQQQTELERIVPGITFQLLPVYHGGWGADSVLAQCREYARIASAEECDYVAKVDSDVLFLPGQEFSLLASSRADAFGDGHYDGNRHFQGGLYFLSRQCCLRLHDLDHDCVTSFITAGQGKFLPGEDAVIFHLLKSKDIKIWLTYYMLFPAEYARRRLPQEGFFPRRPASALHFIGHKADMPGYFQAIFPTLQPK